MSEAVGPKIAFVSLMPDSGHVLPLLRLAAACAQGGMEVRCFFPEECEGLVEEFGLPLTSFGRVTASANKEVFEYLSTRSVFYNAFTSFRRLKADYIGPIKSAVTARMELIKKDVELYDPAVIVADNHVLVQYCLRLAAHLRKKVLLHYACGNYRYKTFSDMSEDVASYVRRFSSTSRGSDGGRLSRVNGEKCRLSYDHFIYSFGHTRLSPPLQWLVILVGEAWNVVNYIASNVRLRKINRAFEEGLEKAFPGTALADASAEFLCVGLPYVERELTSRCFSWASPGHLFPPLADGRVRTTGSPVMEWLESDSRPVVYVGLGTMVRCGPEFVRKIVLGLAGLGVRMLWSAPRRQLRMIEEVCRKVGEKMEWRLEEYVPQPLVLASDRVRCFITHGGSGGVQEGLLHGKPMLCIPFLFDQPFNGSLVELLGVGRRLWKGRLTAEAVGEAVSGLIGDPGYRDRALRVKAQLDETSRGREVVGFIRRVVEDARGGV